MANHGTATLLLMVSLLVVVTISRVDARLTAHPNAAAALRGAKRITVRRDANGGYVLEKAAPVPKLTCNKVHGVQAGETCFSVAQGSGLSQDNFLSFNPNINCEELFVGQWVCLQATSS